MLTKETGCYPKTAKLNQQRCIDQRVNGTRWVLGGSQRVSQVRIASLLLTTQRLKTDRHRSFRKVVGGRRASGIQWRRLELIEGVSAQVTAGSRLFCLDRVRGMQANRAEDEDHLLMKPQRSFWSSQCLCGKVAAHSLQPNDMLGRPMGAQSLPYPGCLSCEDPSTLLIHGNCQSLWQCFY